MSSSITNDPVLAGPLQSGSDLSHEMLVQIASQARNAGFCLLVFSPDGRLLYHDDAAPLFFARYVIPAIEHDGPAGLQQRQAISDVVGHCPAQAWSFIPGVVIAAVPHVDRRALDAVLAVAACSQHVEPVGDLANHCGILGVDPAWLCEHAATLAVHSPQSAIQAVDQFLAMLCDKLRVCRLETELNSLSSQLANAYEELSLIELISGGMRLNRRPADFFRNACTELIQALGVKGMGVAVNIESARQEPVLYGELALPPGHVHRLGQEISALLADDTPVLLVNNLNEDARFDWLAPFARQLIAVPLQRGQEIVGCFFALDKHTGEFDSVTSKLLTSLANEVAIYVENAVLFGDLHALMMGLMHSLTSAIDAKDAYTSGHSERVAILSRHLAAQLGLDDAQVERIYMAGLLHDIGKIGVPELVLQKPGKLTAEEFEEIKKHPQVGARILSDIKQIEDLVPGVLYHHERYDGRGYPHGLSGKEIPLMGRIICLADCFDAMTSNRTYRKALPMDVAMLEIRRCAGTQFDPELAEVFLQFTPEQIGLWLSDHQQRTRKSLALQELLRAA